MKRKAARAAFLSIEACSPRLAEAERHCSVYFAGLLQEAHVTHSNEWAKPTFRAFPPNLVSLVKAGVIFTNGIQVEASQTTDRKVAA